MARPKRDRDNLTQQEHKYALLRCQGVPQREAYRKAYPGSRSSDKSIDNLASKLEHRPECQARMLEIFKTLKISDMDSPGKAFNDLLDAFNMCKEKGHMPGLAQMARLRLDCHGMLKSSLADRTGALGISDQVLLDKLAANNANLRKELEKILGAETFEQAKPKSKEESNNLSMPEGSTKH